MSRVSALLAPKPLSASTRYDVGDRRRGVTLILQQGPTEHNSLVSAPLACCCLCRFSPRHCLVARAVFGAVFRVAPESIGSEILCGPGVAGLGCHPVLL